MSKNLLLLASAVLLAGCSAAAEPAPSEEAAGMNPLSVDDWAEGMNEASDRMTAMAPPRITDEEVAARTNSGWNAGVEGEGDNTFGEPMDDAAGDDWGE